MSSRIEVRYKIGIDSRGEVILKKVRSLMEEGAIPKADISRIDVIDAYSVSREITLESLEKIAELVHNPVAQDARFADSFTSHNADYVIEIGFKPGVTDNVGATVRKGIEAKLREVFHEGESVHSSRVLLVTGGTLDSARAIGDVLANPLIQNISCMEAEKAIRRPYLPKVVLDAAPQESVVPIRDMSPDELRTIAKQGIIDPVTGRRRGPLALDSDDAAPMKVIVEHYRTLGRDPTDAELECLAQTWSEHCKHTIFAAALDTGTKDPVPEGLYRTYIRGATEKIREEWKKQCRDDFLLSVFTDNSGILKFDDRHAITVKVETHNSPSALDPYGGSITGIVGVDRDAIGAGMGAMPYSHRFFFCFDDPKVIRSLYKKKNGDDMLDEKMLSHRTIMDGVIEGVKDGGNKSGIPTPQGSAFFHERYGGKPLVFVGVDGLLPLEIAKKPGWEKKVESGDLVVMLGGRVGLDGIHGATFSSEAMDSGSPMGAVQIGDPITQKKLSDAIIKEARDLGLYRSITDNGAGGLSCSVYEMARECGGSIIDLDRVPLKYPGMRADEILISESQERMTLAVPKENIEKFMSIMNKHDVEAAVIGEFNDSKKARATFRGKTVLDLDMEFFHDGLPQRQLQTTWTQDNYIHEEPDIKEPLDITALLHRMLSRLNICSREFIFEQFDHEVQGGSVVKPMVGPGRADSDATVTRPVLNSIKGVAGTQALFPRYGKIDTYHMAAAAIDTAVRNMVAVGGNLDRMVLLDNFCWCSSDDPERLGQLKRAAKACYDLTTVYLTPLVSGKDSMFNTFRGFDENGDPVRIDVLPTLMISGASVMDDVRNCQTLDAKCAGDFVYVVGRTKDELGGSEYYAMLGEEEQGRNKEYIGNNVPKVDAQKNLQAYRKMQSAIEKGLVASCASVGSGGLAIALAKTAIGGRLGMELSINQMCTGSITEGVSHDDTFLFSESMGRFVVTIDPAKRTEFEQMLENVPISCIGKVTDDNKFRIAEGNGREIVSTTIDELTDRYKQTLRDC